MLTNFKIIHVPSESTENHILYISGKGVKGDLKIETSLDKEMTDFLIKDILNIVGNDCEDIRFSSYPDRIEILIHRIDGSEEVQTFMYYDYK